MTDTKLTKSQMRRLAHQRTKDNYNDGYHDGREQGHKDIIPDDGNKYIVIRERTLKHWLYMLNSAHYWTMNLEDQFGMPNPDTDILEPIENLQDAIKDILKKERKHAENH